jgi:deoxyribodipyrimidine photo-lyase
MTEPAAIWWIRRDLRLMDNPALTAAFRSGPVVPLFILDPRLLRVSSRRTAFLLEGLKTLDRDLQKAGSRLVIRTGDPEMVLKSILIETNGKVIVAEEDFTPFARRRDASISRDLPFQLVSGQTVHHPFGVLSSQGKPYTVYGAYRRAWLDRLPDRLYLLPAPKWLAAPGGQLYSEPIPDFSVDEAFPAGEAEAVRRLDNFCEMSIVNYNIRRDHLAEAGTSALSPYLHLGMLSLRTAVAAVRNMPRDPHPSGEINGPQVWLNELIWREFYIQVMANFPNVARAAFRADLAGIIWRNDPDEFERWKAGMTGVPVVDAGMRQLEATGWMHNRARMITASYLVKDLLIDWRWGEAWFMQNLLDGDEAANNGGWQWVAGTGTDAAPYFRVVNPVLQGQKFDPIGEYVRRWVPELRELPDEVIHTPWLFNHPIQGYPDHPIVEHRLAKERVMAVFKKATLSA